MSLNYTPYCIIYDEINERTYGPFDAKELEQRLVRLFPDATKEVYDACHELVEMYESWQDYGDLETFLAVTVDRAEDVHFGHELLEACEMLGLTYDTLAEACNVTRARTVKAWVQREEPVPADVWEKVEEMLERQGDRVDAILEDIPEDADEVTLHYAICAADVTSVDWRQENATMRRVAAVLADRCVNVRWERASMK